MWSWPTLFGSKAQSLTRRTSFNHPGLTSALQLSSELLSSGSNGPVIVAGELTSCSVPRARWLKSGLRQLTKAQDHDTLIKHPGV